ncbi:MAG: bifunctional riboflavin kinase/FAD synthetase [Parachlamydiaceae bacterium]|nr:bifunctional riboflavin kinase/FAD synthetase [Parachlamydiaceae bacterium]
MHDLESIPQLSSTIVTIGNFDGMHRGHQEVLKQVTEQAKQAHYSSVVITYSNHPLSILKPNQPLSLLCSLPQKLQLFEQAGIDVVILLEFTQVFSQQTAEEFLSILHKKIPFTKLILGHDATLGKNKSGDQTELLKIASKLHFRTEFLPPFSYNKTIVSSSTIRNFIQKGSLDEASALLGRPYSIRGLVTPGRNQGKAIGFPTANIQVHNVCLPPTGVYAVQVLYKEQQLAGIANLGISPTLQPHPEPVLEVHLFNWNSSLYNQELEVIFTQFIRPERKFPSVDALREQISLDISEARKGL